MKKKYFFAMVLTIAVLLVNMSITTKVLADEITIKEENNLVTGTSGDEVIWQLDEDGILSYYDDGVLDAYTTSTWMNYDEKINAVIMYGQVTEIDNYAFYDMANLHYVYFPKSLERIGEKAFYATGLYAIYLPNNLKRIENEAFAYNLEDENSDKEIILPDGLEYIGKDAFYECYIENLSIPSSVKEIGSQDSWHLEKITCEKGSCAETFAKDNSLEYKVTEKAGGTLSYNGKCGENAAWNFDDTKGTLTISGEGEMEEYTEAYSGWYPLRCGITSVVVDEGVTSIGENAFYGLELLKDVTLPESVTELKQGDDKDRTGSTKEEHIAIDNAKVTLSKTRCVYNGRLQKPKVKDVMLGKESLDHGTDYIVSYKNNKLIGKAKIIIIGIGRYSGTVNVYFYIVPKKGTVHTLGNYIYMIMNGSEVCLEKADNTNITKVNIPNTVYIGGRNFKVTAIGDKAFKKTRMNDVIVGTNIESIGREAFSNCKYLSSITINSKKIKRVGSNVFKGISETAKVNLPEKMQDVYMKLQINNKVYTL